jgi:tetratricopeptide (TPR) repeat protein
MERAGKIAFILVCCLLVPVAEAAELDEASRARLAELEAQVAASPEDARLRSRLGMAYVRLGEVERGLELLQAGAEASPDDLHLLYDLGRGYFAAIRYEETLETAQQILDHPRCDDALAAKALVLSGTARLKRLELRPAEEDFLLAVVRDKSYAPARMNLGLLYMQQGNFDGAVTQLEHASELEPENTKILSVLAQAYEYIAREEAAFEIWERLAELLPEDADVQSKLAYHHISKRRYIKAIPYLERAARLAPDDGSAQLRLARTLMQARQYDRAQEALDRAREMGMNVEELAARLEAIHSGESDPGEPAP